MPNLFRNLSNLAWLVNVQGVILVGTVLIVSFCPRSILTAKWRSLLWVLVFVRLAIPVSLPSPLSVQNALYHEARTATTSVALPVENTTPSTIDNPAAASSTDRIQSVIPKRETSRWNGRSIALGVWLIVSFGLLLHLVRASISLLIHVRRMPVIREPHLLQIAQECAAESGLRRVPELRASADFGPAAAGWLKPVVLLPLKSVKELSHEQLRFVLLHEFHHLRTLDTQVAWFQHLVKVFYWFNPAVWIAQRNWRSEREFACDRWVLDQLSEHQHRSYAETILSLSESTQPSQSLLLAASMVHFPSRLERRIRAMRKQQRGSFTTAAAGTLCVLTLVSVGLTDRAQATDEAKSVMPKSDETKETTNKDTAKKDVVKKQSERQPRIIFAKHTIIWEGTEVLSREQTIARLAEWRKNGKVRPKIYMTNGFSIVDNALNDQVDRVPIEVVGQDQWALMTFVQGVRNQKFDSVKTQADLDQPSGAMVRGRVLLPSGEPGSGTQLVLLQKGRWGNLSFNGRTFVDPVSEQCTNTRADGNFELHVGADDYYVAMLHRDGYLVTRGPLTDGTDHTLKAWQTVTVTTAGWKDDQHAEVWVRVEGTAEPCPGWSMKWITRKDQTVEVKVPVGNGRIAQLYSNHGAGAAVGNIAFEVSPDPQQVLSIPPLTEIQRVAGKTKLTEWLSE